MIHKIAMVNGYAIGGGQEHGDVYKILPFIIDGVPKWGLEVNSLVTKNGLFIYDDSNLLKRTYSLWRKEKKQNKINYATKYYFNIWINDEIKIASFGRSLMDVIMQSRPDIFDISSNTHLHIVKEFVSSHIGPLPDFKKSYITEVNNWSDKEDWYEFIQKNQPDFIGYIKSKSPIKMRQELIQELGYDYLGDIIAEEREKKLKTIID